MERSQSPVHVTFIHLNIPEMDMWCARDGSNGEEFNISIPGNCIVIIPQFTLSHLVCVVCIAFISIATCFWNRTTVTGY